MQIGDKSGKQKTFTFLPKWIAARPLTLGVGHQGSDQFQNVLFTVNITERIIVHRLFEVDSVQDFYLVAILQHGLPTFENYRSFVNSMNREKMLKQVLEGAKHEYDFILLDCTPSLGMLTVNALAAADTTLIPVQAQYLSAKGLEQLLQTVQKVRRQINPKLKIEGILLTMTDSRTNYGQQIDNLIRGAYGNKIKVFDQTIPRSVRAAEISAVGKSIFQHDPKGKVAEAYQSLTREVLADAEKQLKRVAERGR